MPNFEPERKYKQKTTQNTNQLKAHTPYLIQKKRNRLTSGIYRLFVLIFLLDSTALNMLMTKVLTETMLFNSSLGLSHLPFIRFGN